MSENPPAVEEPSEPGFDVEAAYKQLELILAQSSSSQEASNDQAQSDANGLAAIDQGLGEALEKILRAGSEILGTSLLPGVPNEEFQPVTKKGTKRKAYVSSAQFLAASAAEKEKEGSEAVDSPPDNGDPLENSSPSEALEIMACYQRSDKRATQLIVKAGFPENPLLAKTRKGLPCFRFRGSKFVPKRILIKKNNTFVAICIYPTCDARILIDPITGQITCMVPCKTHENNYSESSRQKIIEELMSSPCVVDLIKFTSTHPKEEPAE